MNCSCVTISPPLLLPWMREEQRQKNVLLLDMEADNIGQCELRFDLNLVFKPIAVRRKGVGVVEDFYVGSTGVEVVVRTDKGKITEYTPGVSIDVNYTNTSVTKRKSSLKILPSGGAKDADKGVAALIPSIELEANSERNFSTSFKSAERLLVSTDMNDTIKWNLDLPRGEKAIRDYLIGNLYLYACASWKEKPLTGEVTIRASDIRFFDADRRALSFKRSLAMLYCLYRKGITVQHKDGFRIQYSAE